jgi:CubicO group peptidase (beta-lactamase class C family)
MLVGCERHVALRPQTMDWIPRFNALLRAHLASDSVPGAGYALVVNGESTASFAGWADVERKIPITDSTVFDAAPLSDALTALVALTGARLGRFSLDEPVLALARGWTRQSTADSSGLTARRILSHAAGLTTGGRRFEYPGGGYDLLRRSIASRLGIPVTEFYSDYLFASLGRFDAVKALPNGDERATGYDLHGRAIGVARCTRDDSRALCLSTRDASLLLRDYVGRPFAMTFYETDSAAIPRTRAQIPGFDDGSNSPNYGLGHFVVRTPEGDVIVFNGGVTAGGVVYLASNRTRKAAILVVANSARGVPLVEHLVAEWARMGGFTAPPVF